MARLMLSAGMFSALAATIAPRSRGLESGPPPPFFAAMLISLMRRVKILPRLASSAPFLCLIVAHFEWPDMVRPRYLKSWMAQDSPSEEITGLPRFVCRRTGIIPWTCGLIVADTGVSRGFRLGHSDLPRRS